LSVTSLVRSDHECLRWIFNCEGSTKPWLQRWLLRPSELECDVAHKPGSTHYMADSISLLDPGEIDETAFDDRKVRGINRDTMFSVQAAGGYCQQLSRTLNAGRHMLFFEDRDGDLRRRAAPDGAHQVVISASLKEQILHLEHDTIIAGHPGAFRIYAAIRRYYY